MKSSKLQLQLVL